MNFPKSEYEIKKKIGTIVTYQNGWSKEANLMRWNDNPIKLDIREWDPEHTKMSKGITFTKKQIEALKELLLTSEFEKPINFREKFSDTTPIFESDEIMSFKIFHHYGVIDDDLPAGWKMEVNVASWNGSVPKLDIRTWDPSYLRMTKGITLHGEEVEALKKILEKEDDLSFDGLLE